MMWGYGGANRRHQPMGKGGVSYGSRGLSDGRRQRKRSKDSLECLPVLDTAACELTFRKSVLYCSLHSKNLTVGKQLQKAPLICVS